MASVFDDMTVDHVEFYVEDIDRNIEWLVDGYGFTVRATTPSGEDGKVRSVCVGQAGIDIYFSQATDSGHPAAAYVERHGDGIANIGLKVGDAVAAFAEAVRGGARPVAPPVERNGVVTAAVIGFGDVVHTFVQRPENSEAHDSHHLEAVPGAEAETGTGLREVDHFAVCVEHGDLDDTVEYYRRAFDFDLTLTERIETGDQAMVVKVVQSKSRAVTLTLIESDPDCERGHIDEFLDDHRGAGVQHLALNTGDILRTVGQVNGRGIELLTTPETYYEQLVERVRPNRHSIEELSDLDILVDEDHDGQLYQIFAKSVTPRNTIFLELIERAGAKTFGSSNIKSLYEAVETQRHQDQDKDDAAA